jgi:hypothetical protein
MESAIENEIALLNVRLAQLEKEKNTPLPPKKVLIHDLVDQKLKEVKSTVTRRELQKLFEIESELKRREKFRSIDRWVEENVYIPLQNAAKQGKTEFMWYINHEFAFREEEYDYTVERIRNKFPDCDITTYSIDEYFSLGKPKSRISWK